MLENADQNNSEYGHFLGSGTSKDTKLSFSLVICWTDIKDISISTKETLSIPQILTKIINANSKILGLLTMEI